jgi:apolipoprotein N-acyltransferase
MQQTKEKGQNDKQYNSLKKKDVLFVPLSSFFGLLHCLSFCPFSLGCCIVCPFVLFLWAFALCVLLSFFFGLL